MRFKLPGNMTVIEVLVIVAVAAIVIGLLFAPGRP
jgi:hypothetical protein